MKSFRFSSLTLMLVCAQINAIELSEDVVIVGEVLGSHKIVSVLDDSSSMTSTTVYPPSNGGNPIVLWDYYPTQMKELFRHVKEADFAITRSKAGWNDSLPEVYLEGAKLTGETESGAIHSDLNNAINTMFATAPSSGTPLREPMLMAGRFLMCAPGSRNLLFRGMHDDIRGVPTSGTKYRCWNDVDYTTNPLAKSCAKHSLWLFSDGGFYPPGDRSGLSNLYGGYLGQNITRNYDGISTYVNNPGNPVAHPTDTVGMSDVLKFLANMAKARDINLNVNFVLMTPERVDVRNLTYSLDGVNTNFRYSLPLFEHICAKRGGTPDCGISSPLTSNHWDWMAYQYDYYEPPYWPVGSPAVNIFEAVNNAGRYDEDDPSWGHAVIFDTLLGLWHLKKEGMLGHVFIDNAETFEAALPTLIGSVMNKTVARASIGGIAVNGSEVERPDKMYQPYFAKDAGDVYSYRISDDAQLDNNLNYENNAADGMPDEFTRNVWTMRSANRKSVKIPGPGAAPGAFAIFLDWFNAAELTDLDIKKRILWVLNRNNVKLKDRPPTGDLPDPATTADVPSYLGDIVNSKPVHVGGAFFQSRANKKAYAGDPSYEAFRASVATRPARLYVGSNSAMLHAFDAQSMQERFAYLPSRLLLEDSTDGGHVVSALQTKDQVQHKFGVDATPVVQDAVAKVPNCPAAFPRCWRTVLGSGLRRGGMGYFLLDVTDPTVFEGSSLDGENAVLWEYGKDDHLGNKLGFSYSAPVIHASNWKNGSGKYNWVMAFGNGLNSPGGDAYFYVLAIDRTAGVRQNWSNANVVRITVSNGDSDNGLLSPVPVDIDDDDLVDYYYVGDLYGNVHRINVTDSDPANWSAHKLYDSGVTSTDYAVDGAPLVVKASGGRSGLMIVFANGHVYNTASLKDDKRKSVFGIWDENPENNTVVIRRNKLQLQQLRYKMAAGKPVRGFFKSLAAPDYDGGDKGWVVDLVGQIGNINKKLGERVISMALHKGAVITTSHLVRDYPPYSDEDVKECKPMDYPGYVTVFDPNNGGANFNLVRFATADGIESKLSDPDPFLITGFKVDSAPSSISLSKTDKAYFQDAEGNIQQVAIEGASGSSKGSRVSWKRLG